ncbi:MAG: hypothetical protein ACK4SY_04360 [Pyrobaculum sp.]
MCNLYWEIYELGVPALVGPSLLAKIVGCETPCDCDVVIHYRDVEKIGKKCVWSIDDVSFIHRHVWIGGFPHIAVEDLEKLQDTEILGTVRCILERLRSEVRVL